MKIHRFISGTTIMAAIFTLIASSCSKERFFNPEKKEALHSFASDLQKSLQVPGIGIAIVKDNEILCKTSGFRDPVTQLLLNDSTPFFTGNLSELMTATAIMKLAQSGKISLEDAVIKHLPYFQLGGAPNHAVQIKHLLTHTSGVPHHDALWDLPTNDRTALEGITRSIALQQPEFDQPGHRVKRSQYNFDIAADLIEKVSGKTFEQYVNEEVLASVGMTDGRIYDTPVDSTKVAMPHFIDNWLTYSLKKAKYYPQNREHLGSIGWHASMNDLAKWMYMLLHEGETQHGPFLNKTFHSLLLDTHYKTSSNTFVGLGWEITEYQNKLIYSKNHYIGGFCATITLIPSEKTGVVVTSNIGEEFDPTAISDQLLQWLEGGQLNMPKIPVHLAMGNLFAKTQSLDSCLDLYTRLKQTQPHTYDFSHVALSKLGINLLHRLNRKEDAIAVFDFILKQHPSSPYAHLNLAEAYVVSKDIGKAEEEIKIVKRLSAEAEPEVTAHLTTLEEAINIMKEKKPDLQPDDYYSN